MKIIISILLLCVGAISAQSLERPMIFATAQERAEILNKIETYDWAKALQSELKSSVDQKVAAHKSNPAQTINAIIALAADDNLSGDATPDHYKVLSGAAHASILYYLTENEDYAQYAADIIWHYFQNLAPRTPEKTAIGGDYFADPRCTYPHLAVAYDFVYNFLQKQGTSVYDKAAGKQIAFDNATAQKAMKNVAGNALLESGGADTKYGKIVSNHPVLTGPGALAAILCVDDDTERERLFNVFWNIGTKRQNSFTKSLMPMFGEQGIWPESTSYGFMPNVQLMLNMVDRYKPELDVTSTYSNTLHGVFLFENLRHPNRTFVRYGDSKRYNDNTLNSYSYVLSISKRKNYVDLQDKAETAIAQYYNANNGRNTKLSTSIYDNYSYLDLLWGEEIPETAYKAFDYKPTVIIKHAGIALQRNYTPTDNKENGLCGIIGGAHYVHSHVTGISMELYGSGDIMAANGGMPQSVADRSKPEHTDYFRLHAGNNTVIVNGTSHGIQPGSWKTDAYLWQNTTVNIAAEPAHIANPISPNFSFATQLLNDEVNNCKQMRTLSTIRTSPTTAYYFDMFRSKSNGTNKFHDYIYHNIGDETSLKDAKKQALALSGTDRYQNDIGDPVKSPGWSMFENTALSAATDDPVAIRFHLKKTERYMHMKTPGGTAYEYTRALGPATREAQNGYVNEKTQIVAVRKQGEAWNTPFTFVFEPTASSAGSIRFVENLESNGKVVGALVTSMVNGTEIKDYIICNDKVENVDLPEYGISFNGRFAIVRYEQNVDSALTTLYIGEGSSLRYGELTLEANAQKKGLLTKKGESYFGRSLYFKNYEDEQLIPAGTDISMEAFVGDEFVEVSLWLNDTINLGTKTKAPYVWENLPVLMDVKDENYFFTLLAKDAKNVEVKTSIIINTIVPETDLFSGEGQYTIYNPSKDKWLGADVDTDDALATSDGNDSTNVFNIVANGDRFNIYTKGNKKVLLINSNSGFTSMLATPTAEVLASGDALFDIIETEPGSKLYILKSGAIDPNSGNNFNINVKSNGLDIGRGTTTIPNYQWRFTRVIETTPNSVESLGVTQVKVYPNPTDGIIHIQGINALSAKLYNLSGQLVKSSPVLNNQWDVSELEGGLYLLQLEDADARSYNSKIIVE